MSGCEFLLEVVGKVKVVYGENGSGKRMGRGAEGLGEGRDLDRCCQEWIWEFDKFQ